MTSESEGFVEGDSEGSVVVGQWNHGASNTDTWEGRVIAKFKSGAEGDGFRFVTIKGETIVLCGAHE